MLSVDGCVSLCDRVRVRLVCMDEVESRSKRDVMHVKVACIVADQRLEFTYGQEEECDEM
jgi:hypothetical protein